LNCPVGDVRVKGIEKRGDLLDSSFDLLDETDVGDAKYAAAMREPFAVRLLRVESDPGGLFWRWREGELGIDNLLEIGSKFVLALVELFIVKDEADFTVLLFLELGDETKNVAEVEIFFRRSMSSIQIIVAADGQIPDRPEAADMALNDRQLLEHAERLFRDAFGDGKRVGTKCLTAWFDADPRRSDGVLENSIFEVVEAVIAE